MNIAKIAAWVVLGVIAFTLGNAAGHFIKAPRQDTTLVRAFKNNQDDDSIYVYSDGHLVTVRQNPSGRYFFIAYSWRTKNGKENGTGNISFACTKLWTRQKIDSTILANLPMKSECYQTPIYQTIYEFKNAKDYGDFYANTPDDIPLPHHTPCN